MFPCVHPNFTQCLESDVRNSMLWVQLTQNTSPDAVNESINRSFSCLVNWVQGFCNSQIELDSGWFILDPSCNYQNLYDRLIDLLVDWLNDWLAAWIVKLFQTQSIFSHAIAEYLEAWYFGILKILTQISVIIFLEMDILVKTAFDWKKTILNNQVENIKVISDSTHGAEILESHRKSQALYSNCSPPGHAGLMFICRKTCLGDGAQDGFTKVNGGLPGKVFSVNDQCKTRHGSSSVECVSMVR